MTVEEKKIILKDYKHIANRVDSLNRQLARWRSYAYSLTSAMGAGAKGSSSYKLETAMDRITEIEQELYCNISELAELEHRIKDAISHLRHRVCRDILTVRYIEGLTDWDIIADQVGYSRKQTVRLHGRALQEIEFLS